MNVRWELIENKCATFLPLGHFSNETVYIMVNGVYITVYNGVN
jgi:hypothetical protein